MCVIGHEQNNLIMLFLRDPENSQKIVLLIFTTFNGLAYLDSEWTLQCPEIVVRSTGFQKHLGWILHYMTWVKLLIFSYLIRNMRMPIVLVPHRIVMRITWNGAHKVRNATPPCGNHSPTDNHWHCFKGSLVVKLSIYPHSRHFTIAW